MRAKALWGLIILFAAGGCLAAPGGSTRHFGHYAVTYSAVLTSRLPTKVAKRYRIKTSQQTANVINRYVRRSQGQALVTVTVKKLSGHGGGHTVPAHVMGEVSGGSNGGGPLQFHKSKQGRTIVYFDVIHVVGGETAAFNLEITPRGKSKSFHVHFKQKFLYNQAGK
jgi:hypothetical protein